MPAASEDKSNWIKSTPVIYVAIGALTLITGCMAITKKGRAMFANFIAKLRGKKAKKLNQQAGLSSKKTTPADKKAEIQNTQKTAPAS